MSIKHTLVILFCLKKFYMIGVRMSTDVCNLGKFVMTYYNTNTSLIAQNISV